MFLNIHSLYYTDFSLLLCLASFSSEDSLKVHQQSHEKKNVEVRAQTKCQLCKYEPLDFDDINRHMEERHLNIEVKISNKDQNVLKCELCGFSCRLQIQLKKHIERKHADKNYSCSLCQFSSDDVSSLWKHGHDEHPGFRFDYKTETQMLFNMYLRLITIF